MRAFELGGLASHGRRGPVLAPAYNIAFGFTFVGVLDIPEGVQALSARCRGHLEAPTECQPHHQCYTAIAGATSNAPIQVRCTSGMLTSVPSISSNNQLTCLTYCFEPWTESAQNSTSSPDPRFRSLAGERRRLLLDPPGLSKLDMSLVCG